eukprot:CAMPEP_0182473832 /NCGR_PEP_ID=MMETSP1319-20130603/24638_1 /TAXON_ID=172717 /ORGANISM="Bolidomonas pacifica, Strain RCC208" /LENGTH=209 /DNA_ID=CAMNT_0024674667 /DNA_START=44 /DNA_END=673 /DNA_ORIENTATION=-
MAATRKSARIPRRKRALNEDESGALEVSVTPIQARKAVTSNGTTVRVPILAPEPSNTTDTPNTADTTVSAAGAGSPAGAGADGRLRLLATRDGHILIASANFARALGRPSLSGMSLFQIVQKNHLSMVFSLLANALERKDDPMQKPAPTVVVPLVKPDLCVEMYAIRVNAFERSGRMVFALCARVIPTGTLGGVIEAPVSTPVSTLVEE